MCHLQTFGKSISASHGYIRIEERGENGERREENSYLNNWYYTVDMISCNYEFIYRIFPSNLQELKQKIKEKAELGGLSIKSEVIITAALIPCISLYFVHMIYVIL
jgi:hypothetical protein